MADLTTGNGHQAPALDRIEEDLERSDDLLFMPDQTMENVKKDIRGNYFIMDLDGFRMTTAVYPLSKIL